MRGHALFAASLYSLPGVVGGHRIQPTLGAHACEIRAQLQASLAAGGFQIPNACSRSGGLVP
jgi:hypothetical protein